MDLFGLTNPFAAGTAEAAAWQAFDRQRRTYEAMKPEMSKLPHQVARLRTLVSAHPNDPAAVRAYQDALARLNELEPRYEAAYEAQEAARVELLAVVRGTPAPEPPPPPVEPALSAAEQVLAWRRSGQKDRRRPKLITEL